MKAVTTDDEEEFEVCGGLEAPSWIGGGGARYLTDFDWGVLHCDVGEDAFTVGDVDGTGGAGYLSDRGLGVIGFAWPAVPGAWGLTGAESGCGWTERSAGKLQGAATLPGTSIWLTECLLSARMVSS